MARTALLSLLLAMAGPAAAFFGPMVPTGKPVSLMAKRPRSLMRGKSKVVLTKDLQSIGAANEVVTVKDGFYLNYLLPRGLAEKATNDALEKVSEKIVADEAAASEMLSSANDLKAKLEAMTGVSIAKKVGENGAIFGSVTPAEVVAVLGLEGSPKVTFDAVTAVGEVEVAVALHPKVTATVKVTVVAE